MFVINRFAFFSVRTWFLGVGDSPPSSFDHLDISAMYAVARKCIKLKPPSKKWGKKPSVTNTNTADDIERIHFYRNRVCHTNDFKMTTPNFNDNTLDLIGVGTLI